jgi:hypothetical protein
MKKPQDAMKVVVSFSALRIVTDVSVHQAAWALQGFATIFYTIFSVVLYCYVGSTIASPALLSLPPKWAKAAFGIAIGNFLLLVSTPLDVINPSLMRFPTAAPADCTPTRPRRSSSCAFSDSVTCVMCTPTLFSDGRSGLHCASPLSPSRTSLRSQVSCNRLSVHGYRFTNLFIYL